MVGGAIGVTLISISPCNYYRVAESVSWRLNCPSISQERLEKMMTSLQLRGDSLIKEGDVLLFGDSHLQALPAARIVSSTNYSIGGETAQKLADRIGLYPSLALVRAVILMAGRNDMVAQMKPQAIEQSMSRVLSKIPSKTKIILISIPPGVDSDDLIDLRKESNRRFQKLCAARDRCGFVSVEGLADTQGRLETRYNSGDGIHLSALGYELLLSEIEAALVKK